MSNGNPDILPDSAITPFPSLSSLKEAHVQLLKDYRNGETDTIFGQIENFIRRAKATGALLDANQDRETSQALLDYWVFVLIRVRRDPPEAILAEFDSSLSPTLSEGSCPYMGLEAFGEKDKDLYFGRAHLIERMARHVLENRVLAVVGPSGSGKSSLVQAGLLPALKNGALTDSKNWRFLPRMVPGCDPLKNLVLATRLSDEESVSWLQQQTALLEQDRSHLLRLVTLADNIPTVIVVDQFEEIFTLCLDDRLRNAFIQNLVALVEAPAPRHMMILSLRTDFESWIARLPDFMPLFERGQVRVLPLTAVDLRDAIEKPAERIGLKFEDGIVDALVGDILGEPAGLPLLQFTLLRMWKMRERNRISWKTYQSLGDARQALALTADDLYKKLILEDQVAARHILLRLARPTNEFEVTSNRVVRKELYLTGVARDRIDRVLEKLVNVGLVRLTQGDDPGNHQVEVAHEALIRNWPRLVGWLDDERASLRQRLRLSSAAEQWLKHAKDPGALLGGSLLQDALRYDNLSELETEFVNASQAAVQESETIKDAQEEPKHAEEMMLTIKRLRWLLAILIVIYLLTIGFVILTWIA
jgi:energy-coupling factor transporter ATP-binding protein EcfA2